MRFPRSLIRHFPLYIRANNGECEKDERFWRDFGAVKVHIAKIMRADLVDRKKDKDGEYVVAQKKEVEMFVTDVE